MIYEFRKNQGFTLIELLVVIGIIGILAGVTVVSFNYARQKAKIAQAEQMLEQIYRAISALETDTEEWPGHNKPFEVEAGESDNEIWDLNAPEAGLLETDGNYSNWHGPYIQEIIPDPWGNNYFFDTDYDVDLGGGTEWVTAIGSFGPNGVGQNVYDEDNIIKIFCGE